MFWTGPIRGRGFSSSPALCRQGYMQPQQSLAAVLQPWGKAALGGSWHWREQKRAVERIWGFMASSCFWASSYTCSSISFSLGLYFLLLAAKDVVNDLIYFQKLPGNPWDEITLKAICWGYCFPRLANLESHFFPFLGRPEWRSQ